MNNNIESILPRLSRADKTQIKLCLQFGYPPAQLNNNGQIKLSQWKSWVNLQKIGLGFIKHEGESYKFELSELGKEMGKLIGPKTKVPHETIVKE